MQTSLHDIVHLAYELHWSKHKDGERSLARALKVVEVLGRLRGWSASSLSAQHLRDAAQHLLGPGGLGKSTVNRYMAAFRKALFIGQGERLIENVPMWTAYREPEGRDFVPTTGQVLLMAQQSAGGDEIRFSSLVRIMAFGGLRLSEALNITPEDVSDRGLAIIETKTDKARLVPWFPSLSQAVQEFLRVSQYQNPTLSRSRFYTLWDRELELHGLPQEFTPHTLRHYFASSLSTAGVPTNTISAILGHSSWKTTQRYTHATSEALTDAVDKMEERLGVYEYEELEQ